MPSGSYTRKNLITCSKSAYKLSKSFVCLLVPSCQQVWNNLLTSSNILADFVRLITSFVQQICYNHDITISLQPCFVNLVTLLYLTAPDLLEQPCNKSANVIKLVPNLFQQTQNKQLVSTGLLQVVSTSCFDLLQLDEIDTFVATC